MEAVGNGVTWKSLTLFLLTIFIVVVCAFILWPFVPAITGAVVLAIVTQRPYNWMAAKVKNRTLAAAIGLVLVSLSLVGPAIVLVRSVGLQISNVVNVFQSGAAERALRHFLIQYPHITTLFQYSQNNFNVGSAVEKGAGFIAQKLAAILGGSIATAAQVVIMLFLLFFLYRDRERVLSFGRSILPLKKDEAGYLFSRVNDTVLATVVGRFLVAAMQGLVAGVTFASLGLSGATLLGIVTALFAIVPSFGAFVVRLPVAVYLAATHQWVQAAIMAAVGAFIISTLDNFLYPVLVGSRLRMHTVPIFLSILGGVWLFGVTGLVLGPIVFALAESLLTIWRQRLEAVS